MIRIHKPAKAPKILTTKGVAQTQTDCMKYDQNPTDYHTGMATLTVDNKIYGAKSVKNALMRAQHKKCCYCEAKFPPTSYGAVEHYRPKGAAKQGRGQPIEYPGYYWLAYDWDNLLVSCEVCNTSCKGILFPLMDNNTRARNHHDNLAIERPLLAHPGLEDPRDHIRFRGEAPEPRTEVGRITIQELGLRRAELEEARRQRLAVIKRLRDVVELLQDSTDLNAQTLLHQVQEDLDAAVCPEAEYSAMARDFLNVV